MTGTGVANAESGAAVAPGDFNGDGYADLAVGAPGDAVGTPRGGSVTILYGSATGLVAAGSARFTQATADVPGNPTTGDLFGAALSATDMGKGTQDDLAVGVPESATAPAPCTSSMERRAG